MNNKEDSTQPPPSRRKFLRGIGLLSAFSALAALAGRALPGKGRVISCAPEAKKRTVRMLTQDGKLVEIDESLLPPGFHSGQVSGQVAALPSSEASAQIPALPSAGGKKITNEELQNWIKK